MKKINWLAILAVAPLVFVAPTMAAESVDGMLREMQAEAGGFTQRVDRLPETSGKFYLTVVYSSPKTKKCIELETFIKSDPVMQQLISQVNFNEFDDKHEVMRETAWKVFIGEGRPALLLQAPAEKNSGRSDVVYFAKGAELPVDYNLIKHLAIAFEKYKPIFAQRCPGGRCPVVVRRPKPAPAPEPPVDAPVVSPIPETVVTVVANPEPEVAPVEDDGGIPLIALAIPVIAALFGAWKAISSEEEQG